jgi:hypothetical protein
MRCGAAAPPAPDTTQHTRARARSGAPVLAARQRNVGGDAAAAARCCRCGCRCLVQQARQLPVSGGQRQHGPVAVGQAVVVGVVAMQALLGLRVQLCVCWLCV